MNNLHQSPMLDSSTKQSSSASQGMLKQTPAKANISQVMQTNGLDNIQERNENEDEQAPHRYQAVPRDTRSKGNNDLDQFNASVSVSQYSAAHATADASKRRKSQIKAILDERLTDHRRTTNAMSGKPQP
jgi:hypothetical protein